MKRKKKKKKKSNIVRLCDEYCNLQAVGEKNNTQ